MGIKATNKSLKEINEAKRYEQQRNDAAAIAFVVLAESGQVDDVTASEQSMLFAAWVPGVAYSVGQLRQHNGVLYRCVQAHTSQTGWEPDVATSLWAVTSDPAEEWPAWSQPVAATDAYTQGAKVTHNGTHWTSDVDNNVWEPGVYGWSAADE